MKRVGTTLICIGIIISISPIFGGLYMNYKRQQLYEQYMKSDSQTYVQIDNKEKNISYKQDVEDKKNKDEGEKELHNQPVKKVVELDYSNINIGDVIGKIIIPSVEIDMLIVEGENNHNLGVGAGHMLDTAYPGQVGNCVLAGHRNYTFGSMFNRLGEVKLGEEINICIKEIMYKYIVDEIEVIEPTNFELLEQPKDARRVTLLTCHPINIGNKRLLIKGHLSQ